MDIKNAIIEWIGEVQGSEYSKHKLAIDISTASTPKKRYIIYRNEKRAFDLIKNFEANVYKVGDKIDVSYNLASGNYFSNIWRISNHKRINN